MRSQTLVIALVLSLAGALAIPALGQVAPERDAAALPAALEPFLGATLAEARGDLPEALRLYDQALKADPGRTEIRVRFAAILQQVGAVDRAWELVGAADAEDWYAQRTRALVAAQMATRDPELGDEAVRSLHAVLEDRPDDPHVQLALAQVLQARGDLDEAQAIVGAMRRAHGSNPRLVLYDATLLRGLGRLDEVVDLYRECMERGIAPAPCADGLIDVLLELDRKAEAADVLLASPLAGEPEVQLRAGGLLLEVGQADRALEHARRAVAAEDEFVVHEARRLEAYSLETLGRYDEAVARLETLLREDKDNVELLMQLAWVESRRGRPERGRELMVRTWTLVKDRPASPEAVKCALTAARLELIGGDNGAAREWLGRIDDPASAGEELIGLMAATYRRSKQWREGVEAMVRLGARVGTQGRAQVAAVEAEFRLRLGDDRGLRLLRPLLESAHLEEVVLGLQAMHAAERWSEAAAASEAALDRLGPERTLRFLRASALERAGRIAEAEELLLGLVEEEPDDHAAANFLGYMWADRGVSLERSLALIEGAVAAQPDNAAYADSLGWVHFRLGNLEQAELWLRRSLELSGGDGTVLAHLGEVLVTTGRTAEGRRLLERSLELGCDDPGRVRQLLGGGADAP